MNKLKMNKTLKNMLTNWKIIILLVSLVFSYVAIQPQFFGNEGVTIRSVIPNSSAANAGILNPSPKLTPLAKEKIVSVDQQPVTSELEYYEVMKTLQDKGKVTSGQGGGSTTDTPEMIDFRKNFDISCSEVSDGYDITKTGLKKYYKLDTEGRKSYMMLYFRRSKDKVTPK